MTPATAKLLQLARHTERRKKPLIFGWRWYANIHTATNPGGEIRGQMTPVE
jgi:hypothetical protein